MIHFEFQTENRYAVVLVENWKSKHVGNILKTEQGWQYYHKGKNAVERGGEYFPSLKECKESLEEK